MIHYSAIFDQYSASGQPKVDRKGQPYYIRPPLAACVKVGQDVDIHTDAYSDTSFTGKVQRIVMATAGQFSLLPTQDNASGNFTKVGQRIPVVISLDGASGKAIIPGLSVSVTIHIH